MIPYKNFPPSGISHYEIGDDFIAVKFQPSSEVYVYSLSTIEAHHIEQMKKLAIAGKGLNTYINTHPEIKNNFSVRG